ncbi:MAG TPA: hypothetical protein VIH99_14145 [Bdellovibrionota bacterium]|jgi:hypothetical protein
MSGIVGKSEEVLHSWNRCHGAFYGVSESDLLWNLQQQKLVRYWRSDLEGVPALWAEAAEEGVERGISPGGIWLGLYGEIPHGREAAFANAVENFARSAGKKRVAISSDEFHFLPGIPVDEPAGVRLAAAFSAAGFSSADCADFVGEPMNPAAAQYVGEAEVGFQSRKWAFHVLENEKDSRDLTEFMEREFRGRWSREWRVWGERSDTKRAFWNLLRDEQGKVLGFSRLAVRGRIRPSTSGWVPGALRLPLAPDSGCRDTDSCLGPIGISAAERGRGAGKILLGLSLRELKLQGAELTCIDWTNAYNYYTPLGFQIVRRYLTVWKELML